MRAVGSCGTYRMPPLRPELQTAHDEMDATGQDYAFAVCPTWQGDAWEVNTKQVNIYSAISGSFASRAEATAAGAAWLVGHCSS